MCDDQISPSLRADSTPALSLAFSPMNVSPPQMNDPPTYKLYKRRFVGLVGMVRHSPHGIGNDPVNGRRSDFRRNPLPTSGVHLIEHPEPRRWPGLALVRSNCKPKYARCLRTIPRRKVFSTKAIPQPHGSLTLVWIASIGWGTSWLARTSLRLP